MSIDEFRCPLGNGKVLVIVGRVVKPADDPHPYELVFDMESLNWGFRVAGTSQYMRKRTHDFAIYAKGAETRLDEETPQERQWRIEREAEAC